MNDAQLVFIQNDKPVTDSLTVAQVFGKAHDKVLRDIRELGCSREFRLSNFGESTYTNSQGHDYLKIIMTEQGFTLLVMGYTGERAMQFKERYITEFERMKEQLSKPKQLSRLELIDIAREAEIGRLEAEKRNAELQGQIEADKPKVVFADALAVSNNAILVGELAKLLKQNGINIGQNRLFSWLRDKQYLIRTGEQRNLPTQRAMDLGLFEIKKRTINNPDGSVRVTKTTKVTAKGQIYFVNKFKNQSIEV